MHFWITKTSVSKTHKIRIFPKGLVYEFGQKVESFHLLCLLKKDRQKVFADVLNTKEAFRGYNYKKKQNSNFSNGVSPWFSSKI